MLYFTLWVFERDRGPFAAVRQKTPSKVMWGSHMVTRWTLDSLSLKGTVRQATREELESYLVGAGGLLPDTLVRGPD